MSTDENHVDDRWKLLQLTLIVAELEAAEAEDAVRVNGYTDGRMAALVQAERAVEDAQAELDEYEERMSVPRWGMW